MCVLNFIPTPYVTPWLSLKSNIIDTDFSCISDVQDHFLQFYTMNMANPVVSNTKIKKNRHFS